MLRESGRDAPLGKFFNSDPLKSPEIRIFLFIPSKFALQIVIRNYAAFSSVKLFLLSRTTKEHSISCSLLQPYLVLFAPVCCSKQSNQIISKHEQESNLEQVV